MIVRMWEVRAHPEAYDDVMSWACDVAAPWLERRPTCLECEILASTDQRILLVSRWRSDPAVPPDPPSYQVASGPHQWDFITVER